ncbi:MAG: hypothetical protein M9921_09335 [Fimbriimonadaceae bacterium]|nr:hypothetical protein [Fimbriimonadaceae bacterium]
MVALLALGCVLHATPFDFYTDGPYRKDVPRPESILGYEAGARQTTYRDQERVVLGIAGKATDRVRAVEFGKSTEGRPLRVFAISSPKNIARLEELRKENAAIASGKTPAKPDSPAFVWINECIHGNEPASFESGMWLLYTLAASNAPETLATLDHVVVLLNPVYNPDGHERFAVWSNSVAVGSSARGAFEDLEPSVIGGRTNHYRFDLNRDRVAFSQEETRAEVAEFLRWNPQVYADQHGQTRTYFFPPNPMSVNANADRARIEKWTDTFGRALSRAFDSNQWEYNIRDAFDLYYAGYLDSWTSLAGAIGMTHETDGGNTLAMEREDGTVWTFRDGIAKHFVSARTLIATAAAKHEELLASFSRFKSQIVDGTALGSFRRVVVESEDPRPLQRLARQLARSGIVARVAGKSFEQPDAHDYWADEVGSHTVPAGALVIDLQQPQGAIAKALLEPGSDFEEAFTREQIRKRNAEKGGEQYPGEEGADFYDTTAWCLIYAQNLDAWWSASTPDFQDASQPTAPAKVAESAIGWARLYTDREDLLDAARLLRDGVRVQISEKPMRLDGRTYPRGTLLVLRARNEDGVREKLGASGLWIPLRSGYPDAGKDALGSSGVRSLRKPEIGIVFGDRDWMGGAGSLWYLMEREFRLPFTPLSASALNGDLSRYTCLVFPRGRYDGVYENLKKWIQEGGNAVVLGSPQWVNRDKALGGLETRDGADLPGALVQGTLDLRFPWAFGYRSERIALPVSGGTFFLPKEEGGAVVRLPSKPKVLSGWVWPDETENDLSGIVWLHDQPVGRGHVLLFTKDPTDRALWPGLEKLLLNSILL